MGLETPCKDIRNQAAASGQPPDSASPADTRSTASQSEFSNTNASDNSSPLTAESTASPKKRQHSVEEDRFKKATEWEYLDSPLQARTTTSWTRNTTGTGTIQDLPSSEASPAFQPRSDDSAAILRSDILSQFGGLDAGQERPFKNPWGPIGGAFGAMASGQCFDDMTAQFPSDILESSLLQRQSPCHEFLQDSIFSRENSTSNTATAFPQDYLQGSVLQTQTQSQSQSQGQGQDQPQPHLTQPPPPPPPSPGPGLTDPSTRNEKSQQHPPRRTVFAPMTRPPPPPPPHISSSANNLSILSNNNNNNNNPLFDNTTPSTAYIHRTTQNLLLGFSPNYRGNIAIERNRSANIPDHHNCSLFITHLPPDVTTRSLLRAIGRVGRVFATHINPPDRARGHHTAAAKIVFFDRAAAERLYEMGMRGGFVIQSSSGNRGMGMVGGAQQPRIMWNRIRSPAQTREAGYKTRVLHICGDPAFVNPDSLTRYFESKFEFQVDEVFVLGSSGSTSDDTTAATATSTSPGAATVGTGNGNNTIVSRGDGKQQQLVEYRFGSYRCQAEVGKMALRMEFPDEVRVFFAPDPCDI
ncbi:hypothetical protein B0T17DRAFT_613229 [Bombardia bombarda]|uniref:RRM domain-containing protein n=1 Tax=Bombardia bombarda TaxID=252184 RepID=A0AA39XM05_9PEZI|nr:hypothetical protein B0T17DRAFT_613229 [Bombardia bombarda]